MLALPFGLTPIGKLDPACSRMTSRIAAPPPRPTLSPLGSRSIDGGSISISCLSLHTGSRPSLSTPSLSPPRWLRSGSSPPRRRRRLRPPRGRVTRGRTSRTGAGRTGSSARSPALSDLDLRILALLATHRVLTQTQLAAIDPETPARTLRYGSHGRASPAAAAPTANGDRRRTTSGRRVGARQSSPEVRRRVEASGASPTRSSSLMPLGSARSTWR